MNRTAAWLGEGGQAQQRRTSFVTIFSESSKTGKTNKWGLSPRLSRGHVDWEGAHGTSGGGPGMSSIVV